VTGGPGGNGHAYMIPAQTCYITTMGGVNGGTGSPLTFNANTCYAAAPLHTHERSAHSPAVT
jgi:hypothetical protein